MTCGMERKDRLPNHRKGNFVVGLQEIALPKGFDVAQIIIASFVSRSGNMLIHRSLVLPLVTSALKKDWLSFQFQFKYSCDRGTLWQSMD